MRLRQAAAWVVPVTAACLALTGVASAAPVLLQNATAQYSQGGWPVTASIDGNTATGWADAVGVGTGGTPDNTAVYETQTNAGFAGGTVLTFSLDNHYTSSLHNLGRFRLAVTTADRSQFADGQVSAGDLGPAAIWSTLEPVAATSAGGATLTVLGDGSVRASGAAPYPDVYTVQAITPLAGITGVRIDALEDPSFPANGPGRAGNGNYVLSEFAVDASPVGSQAVNIAQAAAAQVVGGSSAVNSPNVIGDGLTTDSVGTSAFMNPPQAPQGMGYDLGGFATVDTVRIYQHSAVGGGGARQRLESVTVHTSSGPISFTGLPDTDVIDLDLGGVETTYLFVTPDAQQSTGSDSQIGIREMEVLTTGLGIQGPWTNVAVGAAATLEGSGWCCGSAGDLTNGITTWGPDLGNAGTAVYNNAFSAANGSMLLELGRPEAVGALGLLQQTYGGGGPRRMIEDLILEFSNDNFATTLTTRSLTLADGVAYQQLRFPEVFAQYVRVNPASQYATGSDPRIGIVEIQLFSVPEPSTLALVGLGLAGLAALATRRNRRSLG